MSSETELCIIGVDPGTTTAVAVLTLDGELLAHRSAKEFDQSAVTSFIVGNGHPLILATDVSPAPTFVQKLASAFGAELFVPPDDMSHDAKEQLLNEDEQSFDSHTRDGIAAARKAAHVYQDVITKVNERIEGLDVAARTIMEPVIQDDRSITQVIEEQQQAERPDDDDDDRPDHQIDWESKAKEYREELEERNTEIERLRSYVGTLKDDIDDLQDERNTLKTERKQDALEKDIVQRWKQRAEDYKKQLNKAQNEVNKLENTLDRYKMALRFVHDEESLLKIRDSAESVAEADGPIMVVAPHVQEEPPEPIEVVITLDEKDTSFYEQFGTAVIYYQELRGLRIDEYYIIDDEMVLDAIDTDSETFMDWLEDYRDRT